MFDHGGLLFGTCSLLVVCRGNSVWGLRNGIVDSPPPFMLWNGAHNVITGCLGECHQVQDEADCLLAAGQFGAAATAYAQTMERSPGNIGCLFRRCVATFGAEYDGPCEEVWELAQRCVELAPTWVPAHALLGLVFASRGAGDAATLALHDARSFLARGNQESIPEATEAVARLEAVLLGRSPLGLESLSARSTASTSPDEASSPFYASENKKRGVASNLLHSSPPEAFTTWGGPAVGVCAIADTMAETHPALAAAWLLALRLSKHPAAVAVFSGRKRIPSACDHRDGEEADSPLEETKREGKGDDTCGMVDEDEAKDEVCAATSGSGSGSSRGSGGAAPVAAASSSSRAAASADERDIYAEMEFWLLYGCSPRQRAGSAAAQGEQREGEGDAAPLRRTRSSFPGLEIVKYGEHYRGVHAKTDIAPDTLIMSIDEQFLITVAMGKNTPIGRRMMAAQPPLELSAAKHCYTAVFVLHDWHNEDSFFQPYYRILPKAFPSIPVFWGEDELAWLQGSYMLQQIEDRKTHLREDYEEIARVAPEFRTTPMEDFFWARMMVASRNFGVNINGIKTDALVPYADMLNHYRPRETRWCYDNARQCFTIHSIEPLVGGAQVYDSYGKKCNSRFLLNYGFSVEYNRDDEAGQNHNEVRMELGFENADADPWRAYKLGVMPSNSSERSVRVAMYYQHSGTREAFSFLRFAHSRGDELMRLPFHAHDVDFRRRYIAPLSCANEAAVLQHFRRVALDLLSGYPTTFEEDTFAMARGDYPYGSNRNNALILVRGEKEVLTHYVLLAEAAVSLLSKDPVVALREAEMRFTGDSDIDHHIRTVVCPLIQREKMAHHRPADSAY